MSGVGFLAAVKTFTPSARRRRRSEKQLQRLELPGTESSTAQQVTHPDVVPTWDVAPPITPPAAFLPANHRKNKSSAPVVVATGEVGRSYCYCFCSIPAVRLWMSFDVLVSIYLCYL